MSVTVTGDIEDDTTYEDYEMISRFVFICSPITIFTSIFIIILIYRTKSRLHTVTHLLIVNTCIASILNCITTVLQYVYFLYIRWDRSDRRCKYLAYFFYCGVASVFYSYTLQAVSRLIFSMYSIKYRYLTTFQTHCVLILIQWLVVFLVASPDILNNVIYYRYGKLCAVSVENISHIVWNTFAYYLIPVFIIIFIYLYIYYQVKKLSRNTIFLSDLINNPKRELKLFRDILISIGIYVVGGSPTILFFLTRNKYFFIASLITSSMTLTVATICLILLNRDLRQVTVKLFRRTTVTTRVVPFNGNNQRNFRI